MDRRLACPADVPQADPQNRHFDLTERGIGLEVLTGKGAAIDTTTSPGSWSSGSSPPWPNLNAT